MSLTATQRSQTARNGWQTRRIKEEKERNRIAHIKSTKLLNKMTAQTRADVAAMEANGITLEVLIAYRDKLNQSRVA